MMLRNVANVAVRASMRSASTSARSARASARRGLFAAGGAVATLLGVGAFASAPALAASEPTTTSAMLADILTRVKNIEENLGAGSAASGVQLNPMGGFPGWEERNHSLVRKHLTPSMYLELHDKITSNGFTFERAIQSSVDQQDSGVGLYAGDEESYEVFAPLFDAIIEDYHGHGVNDTHTSDMDFTKLHGNPDPEGKYVNSTRIRVARNIRGLGLSPGCTRAQRREVERLVVEGLNKLQGDLAGKYFSLGNMSEADRAQLVADHFLFKKGDRFLESCGANRDWPESRGIYHNTDKTFLVWVNEEDQLRIISMQAGADAVEVFARLARGIAAVEDVVTAAGYTYARNDHVGFISSCPTNLGTGMRASVHVKLPNLYAHPDFEAICAKMSVQPRGIHGEHSQSAGGVVDVSNKERLGKSEVQLVQTMVDAVTKLIELEKVLEAGGSVSAADV